MVECLAWRQSTPESGNSLALQCLSRLAMYGRVRRESGKRQTVKVRHGEGVENGTGPSDARVAREGIREAFTGEGAGGVLSDVGQVRRPSVQMYIRGVSDLPQRA